MKRTLLLTILLAVFAATTTAATPEKHPTKIWNRTGPLGDTPKHVTDAFPLSDQENKCGWVKFEPMSDEFEGKERDRSKWIVGKMGWGTRRETLFSPDNATVLGGKLLLTMRKEDSLTDLGKLGFQGYSSADVSSKARTTYGYFEVKAKPMNSAGASSCSLDMEDMGGGRGEIGVFRIGGKAKGFERKCDMNLRFTEKVQDNTQCDMQHTWEAPWRLADDYHVYGLEWDKGAIKYYIDGVLIRSVENTHWHQPLFLTFDCETMPERFGMPKDEDLPSTFSVEYVRVWKTRSATVADQDDPLGKKLSERIGPFPQPGPYGLPVPADKAWEGGLKSRMQSRFEK